MGRVRSILRHFRDQWSVQIDRPTVDRACQEAGHTWRERKLNPLTTIQLLFLQVLHGNTAISDLRHHSGMEFSDSAYCQARQRLPLEVLRRVVRAVIGVFVSTTAEVGLWRGHRVWLVDGSSFSMPDTPELQAHFGQPGGQKPGCGFPVASFLALCDAATGLLVDVQARPLRSHDMSGITELHPCVHPGDLVVGDRAFSSYAHFALLLLRKAHGIFRQHQRRKVSFRKPRKAAAKGKRRGRSPRPAKPMREVIQKLAKYDQLVRYYKPKRRPDWMTAEQYATLPQSIELRELQYSVKHRGYRTRRVTLVTTLLDPQEYPADELAKTYGGRWAVEVNFRHVKITMKMDVLKCETVDGVLKELWMFLLIYNMVRMVMLAAAERQGVPVDRISFIDALRWLAHAKPGSPMPDLVVNPDRSGRYDPRVRKRRPKQYPLMKRPRKTLRKELRTKGVAA